MRKQLRKKAPKILGLYQCDWSSDVCSSDLPLTADEGAPEGPEGPAQPEIVKTGDPDQLEYREGEVFDLTGFSAVISDGEIETPVPAGDISADKTDPLTADDTEITVTVAPEGLAPATYTYTITVNAAAPEGPAQPEIVKTGDPDQLEYRESEVFDLTGFSAVVKNGEIETPVSAENIWADKTEPLTADDTQVNITVAPEGLTPATYTYGIIVSAAAPKTPLLPLAAPRVPLAGGTYDATVDPAITGGALALSLNGGETVSNAVYGMPGATITVVVTPEPGKGLVAGSLKYTRADTSEVPITTVVGSNEYSFEMPEADVTVTASFATVATAYSITVNPIVYENIIYGKEVGYITVSGPTDGKATAGQTVTLSASNGSLNFLKKLILTYADEEGGVPVEHDIGLGQFAYGLNTYPYTFTMPESDVTITATYGNPCVRIPKNLENGTLELVMSAGTVTKVETATHYEYYFGATLSFILTPVPADGYVFKTGSFTQQSYKIWSGLSGVTSLSSGNVTMYTGNGDYTYTAEFVKDDIEYALNLDITGGEYGKVTVDPVKDTYRVGDSIKLTLEANAGCTVSNNSMKLAGDTAPALTTVSANHIYTFTMPTNDVTASVTFGQARTITIDPNLQNGTLAINPNTLTTVSGTTFTVTPTADAGYAIKGESIKYSTDGGATFTKLTTGKTFVMPEADILLTAEFSDCGSIEAGVVKEIEYAGVATTDAFEVPITITAPDSPDATNARIYLSFANPSLTFSHIRIGDSATKLTAAGTDGATGWSIDKLSATSATTTSFYVYPGAVGGGKTFEAGKEYVIYIGYTLKAGILKPTVPITPHATNSTFALASYGNIVGAAKAGEVQLKWTDEEPPHSGVNYYLSTPQQVMWFADAIAEGRALTAYISDNIDMRGYTTKDGRSFAGIGTQENPYKSTFYGQGYTVTYDRTVSGDEAAGFINYFQPTSTSSLIYQLNVNGSITVESGSPDVGLLAGYATGDVNEGSAEGSITVNGGNVNVGGIVGRTAGSVRPFYTNASDKVMSGVDINVASGAGGNIGGLVGYMDCRSVPTAKSILFTYYTGTINVAPGAKDATAGGIVGRAEGNVLLYQNGNGGRWNDTLLDDSGSVTGRGVTGGIVGYLNSTSTTSSFYTNVNASAVRGTGSTAEGSATGGLIGMNAGSSLVGHASSAGTVSSVGVYDYINRNYGNVSGDTKYIGGVAGYCASPTVKYAYNEGAITSTSTQPGAAAGGVMGYFAGGESSVLQNAVNKGSVTATGTAARGGLIGIIGDPNMPNLETLAEARLNYYANAEGLSGVSNLTATAGIVAVPGANLSPLGYAEGFPGAGSGTAEDPYQIETYDQLMWFAQGVNSSISLPERQRVHVKLLFDLDLSAYPDFQSIGTYSRPFYGTFDGDGHKITFGTSHFASLFGYGRDATIKNLTLEGTINTSTGTVAPLVYWLEGTGTLENIINRADITGSGDVAGIAYRACKNIINCFNYGAITSSDGDASGLFNSVGGTVTGCENHGKVTGNGRAAGIACSLFTAYGAYGQPIGQTVQMVVSKCINTAAITAYGEVASDYGSHLSGTHRQQYNSAAGIIACATNEGIYLITECENSGTISGGGNNVGGILGTVGVPTMDANKVFEVSVTKCKNSGHIISTYEGDINLDRVSVGGIVGNAVGSTGTGAPQSTGFTVSGNENTGPITAREGMNVSSIVGRDTWTTNPNGVSYDNTGNTTNQLYGNDAYKPGVSEKDPGPGPGPGPGTPTDPGTPGDPGDGGRGPSDTGDVPGKDPKTPKVPAGVTSDKPAEVRKAPAAEGPVKEQDMNEHRPASAAERIDLEERPREEALRVDEATNEEASPEEQPNENPLDVAAGDIERTVENSPFKAMALGVAGVGVLGGGGYALFRLLGRRRLG